MHSDIKRAHNAKKIIIPALTNMKKYPQALQKLDEVISLLEALLDNEEITDIEETDELHSELADSYGMRGGILRREGDLEEALQMYNQGLIWEKDDSTYNLSNSIVLSVILKKQLPDDPKMLEKLDEVINKLEKQVKGPRRDEWWAWADLSQFYLLKNESDLASERYIEGKSHCGPNERDYKSSIPILVTLNDSLKNTHLSEGIENAIIQLREAAKEVAINS